MKILNFKLKIISTILPPRSILKRFSNVGGGNAFHIFQISNCACEFDRSVIRSS